MSGFEVALLAWGVMCLAFLIVTLGAYDDIREQLRKERAMRQVQRNVFYTSLGTGMSPDEVARALKRAMQQSHKGPRS